MAGTPRRPWLAALLALVCGGLGHLYAGRPVEAIAIQALSLASAAALALAMRVGPGAAAAAALAALAVWVGQAAHAAARARRAAAEPRRASSRPLALIGFYAATVVVSLGVAPLLTARSARTVYAPAGSMLPTIQPGDYLAVAAGTPSSLRGAVVVFAAPASLPAGRAGSTQLLKRVVAVGGDAVELRDGALWVNDAPVPRRPAPGPCRYAVRPEGGAWTERPCLDFVETLEERTFHTLCTPDLPCGDVPRQVVPAGYVWLAGDHRDHSADSRVFGPVAEGAILGEVRWVVLSWGPAGLRWNRTGRMIR